MSGLSKKDLAILAHYAKEGNRELYWNYLAQIPGNDGYGLLALGVVRNDNMPGAVANMYAQQHVGRKLTEREWENFGQRLISEDYERRRVQFHDNNDPKSALNLPVSDVRSAQDRTFDASRLSRHAWTPRLLLEAARRQGGERAAEAVWSNMLDNSVLGLDRGFDTTRDILRYMPASQAAEYTARLGYATALASQDRSNVDPNTIGASSFYYQFSARDRTWSMVTDGGMGGSPLIRKVSDPDTLRGLNDTRELRLERQEKATQFHSQDPYREIKRSPRTLTQQDFPLDPAQPQLRHAQAAPATPLPLGFAPPLNLPNDMRDPSHPGHAAYANALSAVRRMEHGQKIGHGPHSETLAARIAAEAIERKQGITHIEAGRDGRIHVIERHYAMSENQRFSFPASEATMDDISHSSRRWLQARSPQYLSDAPAASRDEGHSAALARMTSADQRMFARIRGRVPAQLSDDIVAGALLEAKRCGIDGADHIEGVTVAGDRVCVIGTRIGQKALVDVVSPQNSLRQSVEDIDAHNQQRAHTQVMQAQQQEQDRVQGQMQMQMMG